MDFNSPMIKNPDAIEKLKGKNIEKVELIYTSYKLALKFSQPKLNSDRLKELRRLFFPVFENTRVNWRFYAQSHGRNEDEAKKLFHGFVITYKQPEESLAKKELNYINEVVKNDSLGEETYVTIPQIKIKKKRVFTGYYLPKWKFPWNKDKLYAHPGIWNRRKQFITQRDSIIQYVTVSQFNVSGLSKEYLSRMKDTTVFSVLRRNKDWNNILFVCDVTGSMSPYTAQVLIWNKLNFNNKKARYFTFFNDGDNMPDYNKRIGFTGGIYHLEAKNIKDIDSLATLAMINGWGGDVPENYIESILSAINKFPKASEVVVVADNWAPIKDIELIHKVRVPVHIILCGTEMGINNDYVRLAMKTGGSIHTMNEDLYQLNKMLPGQKVKLTGIDYQLISGKLKPLDPL